MNLLEYLSRQQTALNSATSADDFPTLGSRYIGGHNRSNQPFISGYHQVLFPHFPPMLFGTNAPTVMTILGSTCEGFTPHSSNINFIDVNGIGQLGSSFPVSRTINREFTLTFREYQSLPILNIFRMWNAMFDPHLGITTFSGTDLKPVNYKGCCIVAIIKPTASINGTSTSRTLTANDIEEIYMYEGVFPTGVPEDTVTAADQATNESVLASVTFKFDGAPIDKSSSITNTKDGVTTTTGVINYFLGLTTGSTDATPPVDTKGIDYGNLFKTVGKLPT